MNMSNLKCQFGYDSDVEEIAKSLAELGTEETAKKFGLEVKEIDGELYVVMPGFMVSDEYPEYFSNEDSDEAVKEFLSLYEHRDCSEWIRVDVEKPCLRYDGEEYVLEYLDVDTILAEIEPEEPKCIGDRKHVWKSPVEVVGGLEENPGVYGYGGGVTITEVCCYCGAYCVTNTWMDDGYGNHRTGTCYRPPDETSKGWVAKLLYEKILDWVTSAVYHLEESGVDASFDYSDEKMRISIEADEECLEELLERLKRDFEAEMEDYSVLISVNGEGTQARISVDYL